MTTRLLSEGLGDHRAAGLPSAVTSAVAPQSPGTGHSVQANPARLQVRDGPRPGLPCVRTQWPEEFWGSGVNAAVQVNKNYEENPMSSEAIQQNCKERGPVFQRTPLYGGGYVPAPDFAFCAIESPARASPPKGRQWPPTLGLGVLPVRALS